MSGRSGVQSGGSSWIHDSCLKNRWQSWLAAHNHLLLTITHGLVAFHLDFCTAGLTLKSIPSDLAEKACCGSYLLRNYACWVQETGHLCHGVCFMDSSHPRCDISSIPFNILQVLQDLAILLDLQRSWGDSPRHIEMNHMYILLKKVKELRRKQEDQNTSPSTAITQISRDYIRQTIKQKTIC